MAVFQDRENRTVEHVVINWHSDNKWLFSGGVIIAKEFYTYEEVGAD